LTGTNAISGEEAKIWTSSKDEELKLKGFDLEGFPSGNRARCINDADTAIKYIARKLLTLEKRVTRIGAALEGLKNEPR
jgi:hypothetical protein